MRGPPLMRQLLLWLLILLPLGGSPCWAGEALLTAKVENGSRPPSGSGDAAGRFGGQSGIAGKLGSGDDKSSIDATWSQGLKVGANGPIPVIVVDQFGYPTKAPKVAVIRDP